MFDPCTVLTRHAPLTKSHSAVTIAFLPLGGALSGPAEGYWRAESMAG